ncbi:MAG: DUF3368 domain-containing protein [Bacillota bacterium]
MRRVVVNATPIISLSIIGKLDLLRQLYGRVYIPQAVYREVSIDGKSKVGSDVLEKSDFIEIVAISNEQARQFLTPSVDAGEAEVMVLAKEINADLVIIDDYLARRYAKYLNLTLTGTLGVLLKAKEAGLVESIKPLLDTLVDSGIYISRQLYESVLQIAGEQEKLV